MLLNWNLNYSRGIQETSGLRQLDSISIYKYLGLVALTIPKKFYSLEKDRFLTFYELFNSEITRFHKTKHFENSGIKVVENTEEEILDVVLDESEA